jgi:enoyl-CoA hydratase/carnithine racemase
MELTVPLVEYHEDAGAGIITLAAGKQGNRLNSALLTELHGAVDALLASDTVRFLLLRSNGPVFCHGLDFGAVTEERREEESEKDAVGLYQQVLKKLFTCGVPVITVLQGEAKGGGVGFVCASDIVVASEEATLELSEVLFGLIPANVLPYLLEVRVPLAKARYLILTAKKMDAREGCRIGLVDEVYPAESLEKGVKGICRQLLRSAPSALARTKQFTRECMEIPLRGRGKAAEEMLKEIFRDDTVMGEIGRFREGELPSWFSKFRPARPLTIENPDKQKEEGQNG